MDVGALMQGETCSDSPPYGVNPIVSGLRQASLLKKTTKIIYVADIIKKFLKIPEKNSEVKGGSAKDFMAHFGHHILKVIWGEVGVAVDHLKGLMAKNLSDCPERDAIHREVAGARVPEVMPREISDVGLFEGF